MVSTGRDLLISSLVNGTKVFQISEMLNLQKSTEGDKQKLLHKVLSYGVHISCAGIAVEGHAATRNSISF